MDCRSSRACAYYPKSGPSGTWGSPPPASLHSHHPCHGASGSLAQVGRDWIQSWVGVMVWQALTPHFLPDMRRDVQEIFRLTPHEKQCMMFSATLSKEIRPVCRKFMQDVSNGGELSAVASASEGAGSCRSPTSTLPSWHKHAGRPAEPLPLLSNWELRAWSTPEPGRTLDPAIGRQVLGVQRPL